MHEVWSATSDPGEQIKSSQRERRLVDRIKAAHETTKDEWRDISTKDLGVKGGTGLFGIQVAQVIEGGLFPASAGALATRTGPEQHA
jgi:hypothetical protein